MPGFLGFAIPALINTVGGLIANRSQQKSQRLATASQERQSRAAIDYERMIEENRQREFRDTEQRRRDEYDREQAELKARNDAKEARLAPRRAMADALRYQLARQLGLNIPDPSAGLYTPPPNNPDVIWNYDAPRSAGIQYTADARPIPY